jgi:hypothetical protein
MTVVLPGQRERPAMRKRYLVVGADGLTTAHTTDDRGIIPVFALPDGELHVETF